MDLGSLYASDWVVFDDERTVGLLKRTDGVYAEAQSVEGVQKEEESKADAAQGPATMDATTSAFHLWVSNLDGTTPDKGDKLVEADGTVWHVTKAHLLDEKQRYRLECRKDRTA